MAGFLGNLRNVAIAGFVLAGAVFALYAATQGYDPASLGRFLIRWCHVLCGVMWIGLLWWFNVVLLPAEPKLPAHLQAALGKSLTPPTFFWRRWAAMGAMGFGLILAYLDGYILQALTLDSNEGFASPRYIVIGIGMWLGLIMWFNAWFVIQPSLRGSPSPTATARRFSRINALLSIPMLFCMVAAANIL